jgi:hypothetical protein
MHNLAKKWAKIPKFSFLKPKILANLPWNLSNLVWGSSFLWRIFLENIRIPCFLLFPHN